MTRMVFAVVVMVVVVMVLVVLAVSVSWASGDTIYVCWDGSGDYLTIQEGIDAAKDGDEVVVCDGIYTGPGNRDLDFGGRLITVRSEFGPDNCIIDCEASESDPHRGFYFHSGETAQAVVQGLTIRNGYVDISSPGETYGGGVYCDNYSSPTLTDCTITANTAPNSGGGVYCYMYSSPTLVDCTISDNAAYYGAGVYSFGYCNPTLTNCEITGNTGVLLSGGVGCDGYSESTLANCTITGNTAGTGGGVFVNPDSKTTLTDCTIANNNAEERAGGVFCDTYYATLTSCTITGNTAAQGGGVMLTDHSKMTLTDCTIADNTAGERGGGLLCEMYYSTLTNCTITGNTAPEGGGICLETSGTYSGQLQVTDCTMADNTADQGGGMCCIGSNPTLTNCMITGNSAEYGGGGVHCEEYTNPEYCKPTLTNCTITGNTAYAGGGICLIGSSPTLTDCTIADNTACEFGGGIGCYECSDSVVTGNTITGNSVTYGGAGVACLGTSATIAGNVITNNSASYDGGGLMCGGCGPVVTGNTISGNSAVWGGGVSCWEAWPSIVGNVITDNSASDSGGGILCCEDSGLAITCNTIASNFAPRGRALACDSEEKECPSDLCIVNCILWDDGDEIWNNDGSAITITYSDVCGGWAGEGNIDLDPEFADPGAGDYHLTANSPCIDVGDNDAPELPEYDIDGDPRILDGDDDGEAIVDMGADEHVFTPVSVILVDQNAPGLGHDGTSWDTAFLTIQEGVDAGTPDGEVWVADGVYVENVVLGSGVQLYGGFLGAEEGGYEDSLSQRRFKEHWTIINGDQSGSCVVMAPQTRVDGFGLTNGSGTVVTDKEYGGAVYCADIGETGVIANNIFWLNSTDYCGGAVFLTGSSPDVVNNMFFDNSSDYGGALYCRYGEPTVANNLFIGNDAGASGGVTRIYRSSPVVVNNTMIYNWASSGAGGIQCDYSSLQVSGNIVAWNSGGGIKCGTDVTPTLTCNDFWENTPYDYDGCAPGTGDISADPEFAGADWGDVHLTGASPCRDTGDNSAPDLPATDWEGEDRIVNDTVDIGADEYLAIYAEAPDPQPECDGPLFGASQSGFPGWVWFSIPLTPDCVAGSGCADPNALLGFACNGRLYRYDKYRKAPIAYQPPFSEWDLAVGDSYILWLESAVTNPSYEGVSPFRSWFFEFRLGRRGWTWVGMPGLAQLTGDDFMSSVRVGYPSDEAGTYRTAQEDYDAIPDNWIAWGWPYWNTWRQGAETFTPYAPFGHNTCYPWLGYRVWVNVGAAVDESDPDQVTLIWPRTGS